MTGREVLREIAGDSVVAALYERGFVCVPAEPNKEMLDAAWADALAESAAGVWLSMIDASERSVT